MLALKRPHTQNTDRRRSISYSTDGAAVSTSRNYNTPQSDCQAGYVMLGQDHQAFTSRWISFAGLIGALSEHRPGKYAEAMPLS